MLVVASVTTQSRSRPAAPPEPFKSWLEQFAAEAHERGISDSVIRDTLTALDPLERVIQADRTQAELTSSFDRYMRTRVTPALVRRGRALAAEHRILLARITRTYGVPGPIVLAIWGVESRYGKITGRVPVVRALATLAWEGRRATFFRRQLFDALTVVDRGYIDADTLRGSWAGAMGQPQFMPSSYLQYAVDFDGDGDRDIWGSEPDTLGSIANYLAAYGWQSGETWGREVKIPAAKQRGIANAVRKRTQGCSAIRTMTDRAPLATWQSLGAVTVTGQHGLQPGPDAAMVTAGTRHFLVNASYDALLGYNCAHHYALSVGLLADRLE
jgi:membrane-bound lytic murein transglycosylase B